METKINSNLNEEKKKKGVNMSAGEAAASAAGIAGVAGAAAAGIATGSFGGNVEPPEPPHPHDPHHDNNSEVAQTQTEEATQQTAVQEPVDPTDVPFTDSNDPIIVEPNDVATDQLADVNVDEIVDEILGIEEVDPTDTEVLAEVVDYEDVGIIYTEDGEEIPADLLAMDEDPAPAVEIPEVDLPEEGGQMALVDDEVFADDFNEALAQETDTQSESFDTMDFSGDFVG